MIILVPIIIQYYIGTSTTKSGRTNRNRRATVLSAHGEPRLKQVPILYKRQSDDHQSIIKALKSSK
jgi:hypothetical protein